jgi:predicted AAA+ superfamily ATPase
VSQYFQSADLHKVIQLLAIHYKTKIEPGKTLLFLDEIQAAPEILAKLRYFYEERPELAVIAAGSLLEFILSDHEFSMPVGRIEYLHLPAMNFEEFLAALDENQLLDWISSYRMKDICPPPLHQKLMDHVKTYCLIGGMPEAVASYVKNQDFRNCDRIKHSLLTTYEDDFAKYKTRIPVERLKKVFKKIPLMVGQKLKYVNIDREEQAKPLAQALNLLALAKVCQFIYASQANGVPLRAQIDERIFKVLFIDIGLMAASCGFSLTDFELENDINMVNQGAVSEQFIGQQLLTTVPCYQSPELFYWVREKRGTEAEIDYVLAVGTSIIPVEVKSGKTGSLRSLHFFAAEKKSKVALRFNSDAPSVVTLHSLFAKEHAFKLVSLPFYLVNQWRRFVEKTA